MDRLQISRERMVREQLMARDITDSRVLEAMRTVPRHLFVAEALQAQAYEDYPLPIGFGQSISQPYVVAYMSQLLQVQPGMRILEVGTGSGYQAAVLDAMGAEVYTVERLRELYTHTSALFLRLRYRRIRVKLADGTQGWPEAAPFDRIIVTAGGPAVPAPLLDQLDDPGILAIPVGKEKGSQCLTVVYKENGQISQKRGEMVAFVALVGSHGWKK